MSEYSPKVILGVYNQIHAKIPEARLSGILGDSNHTYGYHRARNVLPASDYSVRSSLDKRGDGWAAAALDVSFPPAQMKAVTGRLIAAMRAEDPRVKCLREMFGTVNGSVVTGWDHGLSNTVASDDSWTSSDDSHLWHVHFSFYREYVNDAAAVAGVAAVCAGENIKPVPAPKPFVPSATNFPMPKGTAFGLVTDSDAYHSGDPRYDGVIVRSYVKAIQDRLNALGYRAGFADGVYEAPTVAAMKSFQSHNGLTVDGRCQPHDWAKLFSPTARKAQTAPTPASKIPAWPLKAGQYFGLVSGPSASIGGFHASERPNIVRIQKRLQVLKFAPASSSWADGLYEKATADAVTKFQKARHLHADGRVTIDDWRALFK